MPEAESIKQKAKIFSNKIISIRRHLHAYPELSFHEFNTSSYIKSLLDELRIEHKDGYVKTGIVAEIKGKNPDKKTIALRADMDALPITEQNNTEYKSLKDGVMHACGHDVHMSCMLGAMMILNELRDELVGTIKFVFQPGEEVLPGGAKLMLEENLFGDKLPDAIIAQHVFPSMEAGRAGFRNGMYMASTDEIFINVIGKGGHAAMPSEYCNPILIASKILLELQKEFMEQKHRDENDNEIPCVLAFGKINAAGATNIIPEKVSIEGTFRTMNEKWRAVSHEKIMSLCNKLASEAGGSVKVKITKGYPFLVNDESTTNICREAAISYLGKENVGELPLRMTAEDFAWFSQKMPSCFYRLGTGNKKKGITSGVHSTTFDIDEDALEIGSGLMAWLAISLLKK